MTIKKKKILYVEGQDQFRGWFNSSLIISTILEKKAPYDEVLSHGFVVDEKGKKMSKSLGNVIDPEDITKKFNSDVIRLWVISSDFLKEVKISDQILKKSEDSYQKIRNVFRFLLANLSNIPSNIKNEKNFEKKINIIDEYIIYKLNFLIKESKINYKKYKFSSIFFSLINFCINDLSSFYFEIIKDSLYCDSLNSKKRKKIITTIYYLLKGLLFLIKPILPYLSEEIYQFIPKQLKFNKKKSVMIENDNQLFSNIKKFPKHLNDIEILLNIRKDVFHCLEDFRKQKKIISNLEVELEIFPKNKIKFEWSSIDLSELFLVSKVKIKDRKNEKMIEEKFSFIEIFKTKENCCKRCKRWKKNTKDFCEKCILQLK